MPYLRFARDRRGYENTYVMHTYRRRGKACSRVLYWFRTPPDVKVGRAALDEDAIRMIEESNPDIAFDWDQILATRPLPEREPAGGPRGDARRDRQRRRPAPLPPRPVDVPAAQQPAAAAPQPDEPMLETIAPPQDEVDEVLESAQLREAIIDEVIADEPPESIEVPLPPARPVEQLLDSETLSRMKGRYAELLARISQQVSDAAQRELLRSEAERLNPDGWVTADEVRQGLEHFEAAFEAIRSRLPRRRRRGGRRRHGQPSSPPQGSTPGGTSTSNQAQAHEASEGPDDPDDDEEGSHR